MSCYLVCVFERDEEFFLNQGNNSGNTAYKGHIHSIRTERYIISDLSIIIPDILLVFLSCLTEVFFGFLSSDIFSMLILPLYTNII